MSRDDLILAVDGGGTKTVAWLAVRTTSDTSKVIGRGRSGPSNCRSCGYDRAKANLESAIELAFQEAGQGRVPVASACLALAGADRPVEKSQFRQWAAEQRLADRLTITNDALPVLYAASGRGIGVALISGTGSVAVGRNSNGDIARCGGWGSLLGDEGSGYQIALSALRAAVRAADGRAEPTQLLTSVLSYFEINTPSELIPRICSPETDRSQLARFAPTVFQIAEQGDKPAAAIIHQAAEDLKDLVVALATRLELVDDSFALGVSGGVLLHRPDLVNKICHRLTKEGLKVSVTPIEHPVAGAIQIAMVTIASNDCGDSSTIPRQ